MWCRIDWVHHPEASRLPHTLSPWDYALSESEENPIRYAASDGSDIGCKPQRLPQLPAADERAGGKRKPPGQVLALIVFLDLRENMAGVFYKLAASRLAKRLKIAGLRFQLCNVAAEKLFANQ